MKKTVAISLAAAVLALAGCVRQQGNWEYETISGPNDKVLEEPSSEGWDPVGISINSDGTRWFVLKRQKGVEHIVGKWQYKTVIGQDDTILNDPTNQGWSTIGVTDAGNGSKWFLLKKPKQ
jgi:hypothetical protein